MWHTCIMIGAFSEDPRCRLQNINACECEHSISWSLCQSYHISVWVFWIFSSYTYTLIWCQCSDAFVLHVWVGIYVSCWHVCILMQLYIKRSRFVMNFLILPLRWILHAHWSVISFAHAHTWTVYIYAFVYAY